jgi:hypothetical protein
VFASCFYVLFEFRFVREGAQYVCMYIYIMRVCVCVYTQRLCVCVCVCVYAEIVCVCV